MNLCEETLLNTALLNDGQRYTCRRWRSNLFPRLTVKNKGISGVAVQRDPRTAGTETSSVSSTLFDIQCLRFHMVVYVKISTAKVSQEALWVFLG